MFCSKVVVQVDLFRPPGTVLTIPVTIFFIIVEQAVLEGLQGTMLPALFQNHQHQRRESVSDHAGQVSRPRYVCECHQRRGVDVSAGEMVV